MQKKGKTCYWVRMCDLGCEIWDVGYGILGWEWTITWYKNDNLPEDYTYSNARNYIHGDHSILEVKTEWW